MAPALIQEVEDNAGPPKTLELKPVETTLRQLLLDVAKYIDQSPHPTDSESQVQLPDELAKQPLVLRFTGGWVRDKLLGVGSHDIDVAINKMTGYQFGLKMKEYLEIPGNPEKYGLEGVATTDKQSQKAGTTDKSKTVGGLHKIEANPEKSKHLETVTTRILGLDIDLVNLRKETYTEDSRNPQMEFGTPEEDALRRDATVNAMFYNLNTEEIEDFTGRGHDDMRSRIIRTPLEPYKTFKDDPLRILRLIRFASRLDYKIEPKALVAMRDQDIKDALRRKISRERVGTELEKALRGPDPHEALRLIFSLDLYETIFSDPTLDTADSYRPDTAGWETVIDQLRELLGQSELIAECLVRDDEDQYMAWQLAALVPYRDAPDPEPPAPGRKAPPPIAAQVAREGIKTTNKVSDIIIASIRNQAEISGLVGRHYEQKRRGDKAVEGEDATATDVLGMAVRRWGPTWRSQAMYAFLVDLVENAQSIDLIKRKYNAFLTHLQDLKITDAYTLKPLLDGKALAKALNTPPGPWMKEALEVVMAWQLRNPDVKDPQQAIGEVEKGRAASAAAAAGGELSSSLAKHFLKLTIQPLFLKARSGRVTNTGRKVAGEQLPKKLTAENTDDEVSRPWEKDAYALDLLRWVVSVLDEKMVEGVWHLVIPPLLTLIDDWETKYKRLGAELLAHVLAVTSPTLLERTGLAEVFEEALTPCLSYLPELTPEDESVELLSAVYPVLITLAKVRYPLEPTVGSKISKEHSTRERIKQLDSIIRKGVIYSYSHCSEYPRLVSLLFDQLALLCTELGLESVKHLRFILPMLNETLASRILADATQRHRQTLVSAVKAMQAVILNAWPKMPEYKLEVLKGLTLCWLNLDGKSGDDVAQVREETKTTVQMLRAALGSSAEFKDECRLLVDIDERLSEMLTAGT